LLRDPGDAPLDLGVAANTEFDALFSVKQATKLYDVDVEKEAKILVNKKIASLGIPAHNVKLISGNDQALLYAIAIDIGTKNVELLVPVDISDGIPKSPEIFAEDVKNEKPFSFYLKKKGFWGFGFYFQKPYILIGNQFF
jgi:hypothetical protein